MKILIGISHPKQVYMFKNVIFELAQKGHQYKVVLNEKEITSKLLKAQNIDFVKIGSNKRRVISKLIQLITLTAKTISIARKFKPDIYLGQAIPHVAYASFFFGKPFIIFEDTETSTWLQRIVNPFATSIITPNSFRYSLGSKHIRINGGYELAYLSPSYFSPDKKILELLNVKKGEKYVIFRFVGWNANHDIGHKGIKEENKIKAVNQFKRYARVFISSESPLPKELEPYKFRLPAEQMHHAIFYSTLVYGESATMAAEAAHLGTPSIFLDDQGRGYTDYLEKEYDLVYNFKESNSDQLNSIKKGVEILKNNHSEEWEQKKNLLLNNSTDVNSMMIWFIENYPQSHKIMKENPEYQNRFK